MVPAMLAIIPTPSPAPPPSLLSRPPQRARELGGKGSGTLLASAPEAVRAVGADDVGAMLAGVNAAIAAWRGACCGGAHVACRACSRGARACEPGQGSVCGGSLGSRAGTRAPPWSRPQPTPLPCCPTPCCPPPGGITHHLFILPRPRFLSTPASLPGDKLKQLVALRTSGRYLDRLAAGLAQKAGQEAKFLR